MTRPVRRRRWGPGLAVVVAAVLIAVGVGGYLQSRSALPADEPAASGPSAQDMQGRPVHLDPGVNTDPAARPVSDVGRRFVVPSIGLDVPLGAISPTHGEVTPPGFRSVYLIRGRGVPLDRAAAGTVYAATHALRNGTAPGNYLIDVAHARGRLTPGTPILAGGVTYRVTGTRTVPKPDLATDRDVWRDQPGRLVVITCLQLAPDRPAVENLVVTAQASDRV